MVRSLIQLRDDAELATFAQAQTATDVGAVGKDGIDDALLGGRLSGLGTRGGDIANGHDADVDAGDGEVGSDTYTGHSDERVAQHGLHLAEEDFAKVLLDEAGYFVLAGGLHSVCMLM